MIASSVLIWIGMGNSTIQPAVVAQACNHDSLVFDHQIIFLYTLLYCFLSSSRRLASTIPAHHISLVKTVQEILSPSGRCTSILLP